jgi:hypothetical protein
MLKTVSSITNAIGALNFKGTWNASTNTPTLASGVGTKGDYFVVGVAGTTTLDGISTWGVGDWATYNGSVWQRVEGGADLEGVNLNVSGTTNLAALTASTALALDASKNVVSVTNTGTGNNVLGTSPTMATPTLTGDVQMSTGNLVIGTSGKGIDFSATPGTGTSELLADYEEGDWTPVYTTSAGAYASVTHSIQIGKYRKVGSLVYITLSLRTSAADITAASGQMLISGLPYAAASISQGAASMSVSYATIFSNVRPMGAYVPSGGTTMYLTYISNPVGSNWGELAATELSTGNPANILILSGCYVAA